MTAQALGSPREVPTSVSMTLAARCWSAVWSHRVELVWSIVLTIGVFLQEPGRIVGDTKLDLSVDPISFLEHSVQLWNPQLAFGELQNQAYGYLFPMGPFFAIGHLLAIPSWAVDRAWQSVLVVTAFLGLRVLAARLGIGTPTTRTFGALAYCLSPWILSHLGPNSAEALPICVAPWVLAPLVGRAAARSPRRTAAASGVALLLAGGVNATATLVLLILPVIWFVTTASYHGKRRLMAWWVAAAVAATAWWALPLVVLSRYSPPFLTWIESSTGTTSTASVTHALFGTSDWVAYVQTSAGPFWSGGWTLAHDPLPILGASLAAGLGLLGLLHPTMPHRRFLSVGVLIGVALLSLGHGGFAGSPLAPAARSLLDGPLAFLRNVAKFDVVIRIPLTLGLTHALTVLVARRRYVAYAAGALALAAVAVPVFAGQLEPLGSFPAIPWYWTNTASWLARHDNDGSRALLLPASQHPSYDWGFPTDEPMQVLASTPWVVRDSAVLGGAGEARLLDVVDEVVGSGHGNPGLSAYLARAGVSWVVIRNNLDPGWENRMIPSPSVVKSSITGSPGLKLSTTFGPVEIFHVDAASPAVTTAPLAGTLRVSGAPESLLALAAAGRLPPGSATVMAAEPAVPGTSRATEPVVVTDGYRRREVNIGRSTYNTSATLTANAPFSQIRAAHDYLVGTATGHQTVAITDGARSIEASASQSQADAAGLIDPERTPAAAFDTDPAVPWESGGTTAVGQWVQADLDGTPTVHSVTVTPTSRPGSGPVVDQVAVTTTEGRTVLSVGGRPRPQPVTGGPTSFVRVTVTGVSGGGSGFKAVLKVALDGLSPITPGLEVPNDADPAAGPPLFVFAAQPSSPGNCVPCTPPTDVADTGDDIVGMNRTFTLRVGSEYSVSIEGMATGPLLGDLVGGVPTSPNDGAEPILSCGRGPALTIDGSSEPTEVTGSIADALRGLPLAITPCRPGGGTVNLTTGTHRIDVTATTTIAPDLVTLTPTAGASEPLKPATPRLVRVVRWQADARTVTMGPGEASWLVVHENANAGWVATLDGKQLTSGIVDGWQQAFVVPAGQGGTVQLTFAPNRPFRTGLVVGAVLALVLLVLALLPGRRPDGDDEPVGVERAGLAALLGIGTLVVVGGLVAVAALAVVLAAQGVRRSGRGSSNAFRRLRGTAMVSALAAGGLTAVQEQVHVPGVNASASGAAQVACVIALAALAIGLVARHRTPDAAPVGLEVEPATGPSGTQARTGTCRRSTAAGGGVSSPFRKM